MSLNDKQIKSADILSKNYKLTDGEGMHLLVKSNGKKYFVLRYYFAGKRKEIHLGTYPELTLKKARLERGKCKALLEQQIDPAAAKQDERTIFTKSHSTSFELVAIEWLESKRHSWSDTYYDDVASRLKRIVFPKIGNTAITQLEASVLYKSLNIIQDEFSVGLAHKCKNYISQVFTYAISLNKASRNPVKDLDGLLRPNKTTHYPALTDPKDLAKFLCAVDAYQGTVIVIAALKLTPQLLCRPGELRQMQWQHINWDEKRIELPASIMKMSEDHIIPLTKQSTAIFKELYKHTGWQHNANFVFPSQRGFSRPLSENGVRVAMRNMGYTNDQVTPHGFRATARTLLDEVLEYPIEIIEQQLAHAVRDVHGRAYNRTKHLKQRAAMMQAWADYLDQLKAN